MRVAVAVLAQLCVSVPIRGSRNFRVTRIMENEVKQRETERGREQAVQGQGGGAGELVMTHTLMDKIPSPPPKK